MPCLTTRVARPAPQTRNANQQLVSQQPRAENPRSETQQVSRVQTSVSAVKSFSFSSFAFLFQQLVQILKPISIIFPSLCLNSKVEKINNALLGSLKRSLLSLSTTLQTLKSHLHSNSSQNHSQH